MNLGVVQTLYANICFYVLGFLRHTLGLFTGKAYTENSATKKFLKLRFPINWQLRLHSSSSLFCSRNVLPSIFGAQQMFSARRDQVVFAA